MRRGDFGGEGLPGARPGALEAEVLRLAREAMAEVMEMLGREVRRRTPSGATGELRGSVFIGIRGDGRGAVTGVVASRCPYAARVEFGRPPGSPIPPWRKGSPLYLWAARKLEPREGSLESAAFLAARAIARRGVRGRFMFARALDENRGRIERRLEALAKEMAERVGG